MLPAARLRLIAATACLLCGGQALAENHYSIGVDGFRDVYKEPSATVDTHSNYTGVTLGYEHDRNQFFSAIDGRYSRGKSDYKSVSGTLNGTPEIETDLRLRTGMQLEMWHGTVMPYVGVGWRWYFDEGKGRHSSTGALAYDRHISQLYIPVGVTYRFTSGSWNFAPTFEVDPMPYGTVDTHLAAIGVDSNAHNTQHTGYGMRAEFMAGQQYKYFGWQAGPYIRYWHISNSDCVASTSNPGFCNYEPKNTRLQTGAAFRVNF